MNRILFSGSYRKLGMRVPRSYSKFTSTIRSIIMQKTIVLVAFILLAGIALFAQVGIGTTSPNGNAALDISSATKGLLLPRVALSATNLASPLSAHVAGMLVDNKATGGGGHTAAVPRVFMNDGQQMDFFTAGGAVGWGTLLRIVC